MPILEAAFLLILGQLGLVPAQDRIIKKDGSTLPELGERPLEVTKETFSNVEYRVKGQTQPVKLPARDVKVIIYERMPDDYRLGLLNMEEGYHGDAVRDFRNAIEKGTGYHWIEQNALFRIAQCHLVLGRNAEAVKTFRELLVQVPDTRYLPMAYCGIVQGIFLDKGAVAEAEIVKSITSFEASIRKNRLDRSWVHELQYWMLRLQDAKGEDISAQAEQLRQVAANENPALAVRAKTLIGFNLLHRDTGQAEAFFRSMLESAGEDPPGAKAAACTGLGLCILRRRAVGDIDSLKESRDCFLRAVVSSDRYPHQVESDVAARALYGAGRCFAILGHESRSDEARVFARRLLRELLRRYGARFTGR